MKKAQSSQFAKIGVVSIYKHVGAKKTSYRLRWYVNNKQEKITVNHANIATTIASQIDTDIGNGIYHSKDYYDPKRKIAKQAIDENYRYLDYLWFEWKKIEHEYALNSLDKHKRISMVLKTLASEPCRLDNAHAFLDRYRGLGYADSTIKRDLTDIITCVNYWVKLGKVAHNPYPVIKSQLKPKKQDNKGRFTDKEKEAILWWFATKTNGYCELVQFLFMAGLRPEEVIPLTWGDVNLGSGTISINKTYSKGSLRHNTKQGKKGKIIHRKYALNNEQRYFLMELYDEQKQAYKNGIWDDNTHLIFPSPTGTYINWGNFTKRIWKTVVNNLVKQGKVRKYLKPYCMRHTYITNEIKKNTPLHVIAQQCGTSIEMIVKTYLISNDWWLDGDTRLDVYDSYVREFG